MDKIKLKITTEKLRVVNACWSIITKDNLHTPEQKLLYDITSKLGKKFKKKFIEKEFNDVEYSINLDYYEAYFFNKVLDIYLLDVDFSQFPYEYNVVFSINNYVHQKLV
jgi:hypothetical protein